MTSGEGQLIINLKAQRLNSKGVGKVATLAAPRWVDRIGAFCFGLKLSSIPSVLDRNYMLETEFLFKTEWFSDHFHCKTDGSMHDSFCYDQHVRNLISAQK